MVECVTPPHLSMSTKLSASNSFCPYRAIDINSRPSQEKALAIRLYFPLEDICLYEFHSCWCPIFVDIFLGWSRLLQCFAALTNPLAACANLIFIILPINGSPVNSWPSHISLREGTFLQLIYKIKSLMTKVYLNAMCDWKGSNIFFSSFKRCEVICFYSRKWLTSIHLVLWNKAGK